jgi:hypothetical protein
MDGDPVFLLDQMAALAGEDAKGGKGKRGKGKGKKKKRNETT